MRSRPWSKYVAVVVLVGMVVPGALAFAGASDRVDEEAEAARQREAATAVRCGRYADSVRLQLQQYVAAFDASLEGRAQAPQLPAVAQLRAEAREVLGQVARAGCDRGEFRATLDRGLDRVYGSGTVGRAVADVLVANVRDVLEPRGSRRVVVQPGDDLHAVLGTLPDRTTLVLPPGTFELDEPVLVLQNLVVRGAGSDATRIRSTAEGSVVTFAAPARLLLEGVTLEHIGARPASTVEARAGTLELEDVVISGGRAAADADPGAGEASPEVGLGGNGLLAVDLENLVVRDTVVEANDAGGLVLGGRTRSTISGSRFSDNGSCGLCFFDRASGIVRDSASTGNSVGVVVANRATPTVTGSRLTRNERAGMVVQHRAAPDLRDNRIAGNSMIGVAAYDASSPLLVRNIVSGNSEAGIVLESRSPGATVVRDNVLTGNAQAALVFLGDGRGVVAGNRCSGGRFQLVLDGAARPRLRDNACTVSDQR